MGYTSVDGKVVNDDGDVAMYFRSAIQHVVRVDKTTYVFIPKKNVCMAWIKPQHIDQLLQLRKTCCGGNNSVPAYRYTSLSNVRRWSGDGER